MHTIDRPGRNDRCPCGSGFKHKHCCGAPQGVRRSKSITVDDLPPKVLETARRIQKRHHVHGHGRHPESVLGPKKRSVRVGGREFAVSRGTSFHDFLISNLRERMGAAWWAAEGRKTPSVQHPVVGWHMALRDSLDHGPPRLNGIREMESTRPMRLILEFAYDFYTWEHNSVPVAPKLMNRLKHVDQFQGAQYELHVGALFLIAGFAIDLEDESDPSLSHCEFSATHKPTGRRYSVEVKSRSRPGLLGKQGEVPSIDTVRVDGDSLLKDALRKRAEHDRIVFIEVNVPSVGGGEVGVAWLRDAAGQITRLMKVEHKGPPWPPAIVVFTNKACHFFNDEVPAPGLQSVITGVNMPDFRENAEATRGPQELFERHPEIRALVDRLDHHLVPLDW